MKNNKLISTSIAIVGFIVFLLTSIFEKFNITVYKQLDLIVLSEILIALGLFLYNFCKDEQTDEKLTEVRNKINYYLLTALYSTLIVYSLVQNISGRFEVNMLVLPLLFLVLQTFLVTIFRYKSYSQKLLVLLLNTVALVWLIYFVVKLIVR